MIDLPLLLLRGVVGAVMLAHGANHIWGGGGIAGTAAWFDDLGMRPGRLHAWLASATELVAGALLVLGLLTPFAAAAVIGVLLVAGVTNHRGAGFFVFHRPTEGWEYLMTLVVVSVAVSLLGPGDWSLDAIIGVAGRLDGWSGFAIAVGGGGISAAMALVLTWRPTNS